MAFPTVLSRTPTTRGSDSTTQDVAIGAVSAGDLIVIVFSTDGSGASNFSTSATNGGAGGPYTYQKPLADENHSGGCNAGVRWRIADGTETSPQRFTTSSSEHLCARAYVIDAGTFDATTPLECGDDVEGSSTTPDPPALTPSWGALDTLWLAFYGADDDDESSAAPTDYLEFVCLESAQTTTSCSLGVSERQLNAVSEDPGAYTMAATEEWIATTIAIQPAAAGGDITKDLTSATETDTAQALTKTQAAISKSLTNAAETDAAQALAFTQVSIEATLGIASETNVAQVLAFTQEAISKTLTPATETDTAVALTIEGAVVALARMRSLMGLGS